MLKDEGFDVHHDESVSKIIRRNYIEGKRRDLKFKAQRFPAGFEIVFYQDIVHETHTAVFMILINGEKCRI